MLREAANESARVFSPTAGHRATEQRRDLARIPELLSPLSLAGRPPEKLAPSARPPTYQESLKSLPFFFYNHKMEGMESKVYDELLNNEQKQHDGDEEEHLDYRRRKHSSWSIGRSIHLFITTVLALALIYQQWRFSRQQICHRGFPTDYGKKDLIPGRKEKVVDRRIRPILTFLQGTWEISLVSRNRNIPTPLSSLKIVPDWKFHGRTIDMPQNLGMRLIERGTNFSHVSTYYRSPRGRRELPS